MRILTDCSFLSEKQIEKIAEKYNAKYVFESQLKLRGGNWSDFPAAVFYTEDSPPRGIKLVWNLVQQRNIYDIKCYFGCRRTVFWDFWAQWRCYLLSSPP